MASLIAAWPDLPDPLNPQSSFLTPPMKYMLLVYMDEQAMTDAERSACYVESAQLCHDLQHNGQFVAANPLQSVASATSLRVRDSKRTVIDGPFAETREQLGGFFLIDVRDLDEAMRVAERIPAAKKGTIEIRPLFEIPGLPGE